MEVHARAPDPLTNVGDMANNWQSWKEDFIIFMKVTGYIDKPNEVCANLLKNRIGKVGIDAIQKISFENPQDKDDMNILITKLEEYFNPPKKEVVERYQFFTKSRKQNESIEQYINSLREKAKTCNFKEMTDSLILDKVILDTHDKILRKKLFEVTNLDLQKLVVIYNDYNINLEKMKQVTQENKVEAASFKPKPIDNTTKGCCWRCGHQHPHGKCPAWGSKCTKCDNVNHFTQCCRGFKFNPKSNDGKVNPNILDPTHAKVISKNNDKLRSNPTDSPVIVTITDAISETTFPDIPTVLGNRPSCDDTCDSVLYLLDTCNTSSNHDNTAISSTQTCEKSRVYPYAHSYMSEAKPDWTLDLHNKKSEPKTIYAGTCEEWDDISSKNISIENIIYNDRNEDEAYSTVGATSVLRYNPPMIFVLMMLYTLWRVLTCQMDCMKRCLASTLNMFVNIIFCSCISRNR